MNNIKKEEDQNISPKNEIILGLDVSTACIGCCIFLNDTENMGKIVKLTHVAPKVSSKIKGIEQLFIKKNIFETEFLTQWQDKGITKVVIEEPLLSSNNVNTVATLLRFNGMISDSVYHVLGIVPEYISSYDARKHAFPELVTVRKFNKLGESYDLKHLKLALKNNKVVLFGSYSWDCDKKLVLLNKMFDIFPEIEWIYDKKGELKKENFDASDALVTCLATSNLLKYGNADFKIENYEIKDNTYIHYNVKVWDKIYSNVIDIS